MKSLFFKALVIIGTVSVFLATFIVSAGACSTALGETEIPDVLK